MGMGMGMDPWMMVGAPTSRQALNTHWTKASVPQANESCIHLPSPKPVLSASWDLGPASLGILAAGRPAARALPKRLADSGSSVQSSDVDLTRC